MNYAAGFVEQSVDSDEGQQRLKLMGRAVHFFAGYFSAVDLFQVIDFYEF
ncbi:hypothetical protein [Collimonas sp. OK307]|nr:hypothetical protein [Collimonas sp. OK307]